MSDTQSARAPEVPQAFVTVYYDSGSTLPFLDAHLHLEKLVILGYPSPSQRIDRHSKSTTASSD